MMFCNLLKSGCLLLVLSGCLSSNLNLSQGISSFQVQDYRQAFVRLRPEAEKGVADAQYAIGYMYYYGQGVIEDRRQAWYWITQAAQKGQKDAITAMSVLKKSANQSDFTS